jgi:hypothetical protein
MPWRRTVLGALALSLVLSPIVGQAAHAEDDFTYEFVPEQIIGDPVFVPSGELQFVTPKVITSPVVIDEPWQTVERGTTTIDLMPTTTVVEPTTVITPKVIERRAIIPTVIDPTFEPTLEEQTVSVETTTTSTPASETTFLSAAARKPLFNVRVNNIKQQIDKGIANGWLSSAQAAEFQARADALMNQADQQLVSDANPSLSDPIERSVNQLNIDVSSAMQFHPMIGSGSQFQ